MTTELPVAEARQGGCQCGCSHDAVPELDARELPKAIRHGAILGALASLAPGGEMILIAPHEPTPLLAQIDELYGDAVQATIIDRQPEKVRVRLLKVHAVNE